MRTGVSARGEGAFVALLRLYPQSFRMQFGSELVYAYRAMRLEPRHSGFLGFVRLWLFVLRDLTGSIARERAAGLRPRSVPVTGAPAPVKPPKPPYFDALIAGLGVFALYLAT